MHGRALNTISIKHLEIFNSIFLENGLFTLLSRVYFKQITTTIIIIIITIITTTIIIIIIIIIIISIYKSLFQRRQLKKKIVIYSLSQLSFDKYRVYDDQ